MYRDDTPLSYQQHVHFLMPHAALGDLLTSLPAIVYARKMTSLDQGFTVWVPEHQVPLVRHLIGGPGIEFKNLHEFQNQTRDKSKAGPAVMNAVQRNVVTRNKMDLVTFGFITQLDKIPQNVADLTYPHWAPIDAEALGRHGVPLTSPYVVISTGATSDNKIFHPKVLKQVIHGVKSMGYEIVVMGRSTTHVKATGETVPLQVRDTFERLPEATQKLCIDLRDKTDLMDARSIIGHSQCMIGVDGGLLHLAGTTNVPIVYGITTVDPTDRGITRHGRYNWKVRHVTPKDLACAGCQSHWILAFGQDFRHCAYDDYKCVELLDPNDFLNAIKELTEEDDNEVKLLANG